MNTRRSLGVFLGALAVVSIAPDWLVSRTVGVLMPVELSAASAPVQADPSVIRSRYLTIDFDALSSPGAATASASEPSLQLELFPNLTITAVFDRFDPNADGVTWVGHVDRVPMSVVTLVYSGGLMAGTISMPSSVYSIRPAPEDVRRANASLGRELHVVAQIDQSALPKEAEPIAADLPAGEPAAFEVQADSADVIDVMMVYTSQAMAGAGGATGIINLINLGISDTNTSYANSGINQRLRLVHTAFVPYTETSAFQPDLTNLRAGNGDLSGVLNLRNTYGADLVMMLIHPPSPQFCGIAFVMNFVNSSFESSGYSVTDTQCVTSWTVAHEFGHNMGAQHDWYVSSTTLPFTYAHGYVNPSPGQRFRTIMAYPDHCSAQGFSCTRLLSWANPRIKVNQCASPFDCSLLQYWYTYTIGLGVPEGTSIACQINRTTNPPCDADDSRVLNNTAFVTANHRQSVTAALARR